MKRNFAKPYKISTHSAYSDNCYFHFFYRLSDWVQILWGFMKFFFKQTLKISAFYLEKQKSFIPNKIWSKPYGQNSSFLDQQMAQFWSEDFGCLVFFLKANSKKLWSHWKMEQSKEFSTTRCAPAYACFAPLS